MTHGARASGSGVQGTPGGGDPVLADLSEDHIGEVDAEPDRVGLVKFGDEAATVVG